MVVCTNSVPSLSRYTDEEDAATAEIKALSELIAEVERQFANVDVTSDGITQAFFGKSREMKAR